MVAAIRPDDWNLPLLLHVGGAMLLVGALVLAAVSLARAAGPAGSPDSAILTRLGFRTLLLGALPAYIVMRGAAEWIASKEGVEDQTWIGIGYMVSDAGLLVLLATAFVSGRAARRTRAGGTAGRAAAGLTLLLVVAYGVAVWAMTAKPG